MKVSITKTIFPTSTFFIQVSCDNLSFTSNGVSLMYLKVSAYESMGRERHTEATVLVKIK